MKSPLKFDYNIFWICMGGGVVIAAFAHLLSGEPLTWYRLLILLGLMVCFFVLGCVFTAQSATMFHRKVNNPVDPQYLIKGGVYWLNGETNAVYVGQDPYRGTYGFHFIGYHSDKDITECMYLFPGVVRLYISNRMEEGGNEL